MCKMIIQWVPEDKDENQTICISGNWWLKWELKNDQEVDVLMISSPLTINSVSNFFF